MAEAVYILCALTAILCAVFLFRAWWRTRAQLLLWSMLCFAMLSVNNILLYIDLAIYPGPQLDLSTWRNLTAAVGLGLLVFGLIWDSE